MPSDQPSSVSAIAIRPADEADIPAITAIYADAVRHGTGSFEIEPPGLKEMTARWRTIEEAELPWLVAEGAAGIVGYAYAGPYRPRPGYRGTLASSVYVAPGMQGQGTGRRLLAALLDASEAAGARQMVATVGDSANKASIRLHAAAGFETVGILRSVGWKHGRWLDTVIMQRALGPGDGAPLD
ncbi:MAG: N-acetyltransferase family protein [Pseudomonadota bacterium]